MLNCRYCGVELDNKTQDKYSIKNNINICKFCRSGTPTRIHRSKYLQYKELYDNYRIKKIIESISSKTYNLDDNCWWLKRFKETITNKQLELMQKTYSIDLDSYKDWRNIKKQVFKRDNHICRKCGKNENLTIHYLNFMFQPNISNLIVLCKKCRWKECKKYVKQKHK